MSPKKRIGPTTTTTHAPSLNFAMMKINTTVAERKAAKALMTRLRLQCASR